MRENNLTNVYYVYVSVILIHSSTTVYIFRILFDSPFRSKTQSRYSSKVKKVKQFLSLVRPLGKDFSYICSILKIRNGL